MRKPHPEGQSKSIGRPEAEEEGVDQSDHYALPRLSHPNCVAQGFIGGRDELHIFL